MYSDKVLLASGWNIASLPHHLPPTGWTNWPKTKVHISKLWQQLFPCQYIHVYPISIIIAYFLYPQSFFDCHFKLSLATILLYLINKLYKGKLSYKSHCEVIFFINKTFSLCGLKPILIINRFYYVYNSFWQEILTLLYLYLFVLIFCRIEYLLYK